VLGVLPDQKFAVGAVELTPGDRLVFFTDGVTESCNAAGDEFAEERLLQLLDEHRDESASALQGRILASVGEFSRGQRQDDVTLLVLAVDEE
jgi:sigma-B regulation protein RsbU (phosphoserine phosphatase)